MNTLEYQAGAASDDPLVGRMFADRYRIVGQIAVGGMGVVYRARQVSMDRWVALKVLKHPADDTVPVEQWFYREMRAAARVQHPNTVRVYDFGQVEDGSLYLAMEMIEGRSLQGEIATCGAFAPGRAVHVAMQVAKALNAAHHEDVVHRDLKADNILLVDLYGERDFVKVVDFGIAMVRGSQSSEPRPGFVTGTPEYMSPEQATGERVDHRTDLYALGVLLYEMCTGSPPFTHADPAAVLRMHVNTEPRSPTRVLGSPLPEPLEALILALLRKRVEERPQDATEVIELLGRCASHPAISRRSHQRWEGAVPPVELTQSRDERTDWTLGSTPSDRTLVSTPSELGIPVVPKESVSDIDVSALRPVRLGRVIPAALAVALVAVGLWVGPPDAEVVDPMPVDGAAVTGAALARPVVAPPLALALAHEVAAPPLSVPRGPEAAEARPRGSGIELEPLSAPAAAPEPERIAEAEAQIPTRAIDSGRALHVEDGAAESATLEAGAATASTDEAPPDRPRRRRRQASDRRGAEDSNGALAAAHADRAPVQQEAADVPVAESPTAEREPEPPRIERWRPRSEP